MVKLTEGSLLANNFPGKQIARPTRTTSHSDKLPVLQIATGKIAMQTICHLMEKIINVPEDENIFGALIKLHRKFLNWGIFLSPKNFPL